MMTLCKTVLENCVRSGNVCSSCYFFSKKELAVPFKGPFHETTKHANESTLVVRLEANDQNIGLSHRLV